MQANKPNRLKLTLAALTVMALLGFIYFTQAAIHLFLWLDSDLHADTQPAGLALVMIALKPAIFLALIVSATGLYRLRRWGLYLANSAMAAYLATFALTLFANTGQLGGAGPYQLNPQWPVFLRYSYNWDTLILPSSIVILLILLNFTRPLNPHG